MAKKTKSLKTRNIPLTKSGASSKHPRWFVDNWFENKIKRVQVFSKHYASRAARYGALAGVSVLFLITIYSLSLPSSRFLSAQQRIIKNHDDIEAHLIMAEEFLENNQLKEAENELNTVRLLTTKGGTSVLGATSWFGDLWGKFQESSTRELIKLVGVWENFVKENPDYRDAYLRLSLYYYKLGNHQKAEDNLKSAHVLDPNFPMVKELEKLLED